MISRKPLLINSIGRVPGILRRRTTSAIRVANARFNGEGEAQRGTARDREKTGITFNKPVA